LASLWIRKGLNIRAMKLSSSGDFGVVKFLVDKPDECYVKLKEKGISVYKRDIVAIILKDEPGGLFDIADKLAKNNINIEDAYAYVIEDKKIAVLIIETNNTEKLKQALDENKIDYYKDPSFYEK
ncbi:MAG TPA: ACT domain-containing protein, partial [bacterium]|nr:ACT domain-containing protein [bacterium]